MFFAKRGISNANRPARFSWGLLGSQPQCFPRLTSARHWPLHHLLAGKILQRNVLRLVESVRDLSLQHKVIGPIAQNYFLLLFFCSKFSFPSPDVGSAQTTQMTQTSGDNPQRCFKSTIKHASRLKGVTLYDVTGNNVAYIEQYLLSNCPTRGDEHIQ